MPQFFIKSSVIKGNKCILDGDDYHHLVRVRRIKKHDVIQLRDQNGSLYTAKVVEIDNERIKTEIIEKKELDDNLLDFTLCLALLKGKKFDMAIQKAVEIGVNNIFPVTSERTISIYDDKKKEKNKRWNKIATEASKQCMRERIPFVHEVTTFKKLIENDSSEFKVIASPGADENIGEYFKKQNNIKSISLLIGPEGGFSPDELNSAEKNGWTSLNFGFTQLRAETAAIVLSSIIVYEWSLKQ